MLRALGSLGSWQLPNAVMELDEAPVTQGQISESLNNPHSAHARPPGTGFTRKPTTGTEDLRSIQQVKLKPRCCAGPNKTAEQVNGLLTGAPRDKRGGDAFPGFASRGERAGGRAGCI